MDRYCSHQTPYKPTTGQVYLDRLRLNGQEEGIDDCFRALEFRSGPLSASELEEYYRHKALAREANGRWARVEQVRPVRNRAFTLPNQCSIPVAKVDHGKNSTHGQRPGGIIQHSQPKPGPHPVNPAVDGREEQRILRTRREQSEFLEFQTAEWKRRVARVELDAQKYHRESPASYTTLPPLEPDPTDRLFSPAYVPIVRPVRQTHEQSKAEKRQRETPVCGHWVPQGTNDVLLNARAMQEAGRGKPTQQTHEQGKVQLPAARPGSLYPRPSRMSGPVRITHDIDLDRSIMSDLALSVHLKSKMACQEAYRRCKEERERKKEEEQRKASLSGPTSEATRTESVKQLLASVKKVLEPKVEAGETDADGLDDEALRAQPQLPHGDLRDASEAARKRGQSFWHEYARSYPTPRQPDGIHCSTSHDSASVQPMTASPDRWKGADEEARHTQNEVPLDPSRTSDYRAAIEAIDKVSGDRLRSPETASGRDEPSSIEPSTASLLRTIEKCVAKVGRASLVVRKDPPAAKSSENNVAAPPVSQTGERDTSPVSRGGEDENEHGVAVDTAATAEARGDLDIEMEWLDVGGAFADDDAWSDVERDFEEEDGRTGGTGGEDVEWAEE